MTFRELLNTFFDFNIIEVNQGKQLPPYPFATFQIVDENRDGMTYTDRNLINGDLDIEEIQYVRVEAVTQIDVYGSTYDDVNDTIRAISDGIKFKHYEQIRSNGFGIIEINSIGDNTTIDINSNRKRKTIEVVYEFTAQITREIENLQAIEFYELKEGKIERVER